MPYSSFKVFSYFFVYQTCSRYTTLYNTVLVSKLRCRFFSPMEYWFVNCKKRKNAKERERKTNWLKNTTSLTNKTKGGYLPQVWWPHRLTCLVTQSCQVSSRFSRAGNWGLFSQNICPQTNCLQVEYKTPPLPSTNQLLHGTPDWQGFICSCLMHSSV